ncbi:low molecular weight protein-tyrosine-phosphatase [Bacteroidota bacterium]
MVKVLFVCLGNICRSPLAEGVFKNAIKIRGLSGKIECDSAGTSTWHIGEIPDPRSIEIAEENGISLDHFGQQVNGRDFSEFDYIVAMDDNNRQVLISIERRSGGKAKIIKMMDFDDYRSGGNVPDPYYGGHDGFQRVFNMLEESCSNFIDYLVEEHQLA